MTIYLDIAVVRIQSWLTRAPSLRGRRGASAMIRDATAPTMVDTLLEGWGNVAKRCTAAGNIDGVIPLELCTEDPDAIQPLEEHIMRHLRGRLPAASFESVRREGRTWLAAQLGEPVQRCGWPAATAEWPPGRRCEWCNNWPANNILDIGPAEEKEKKALCVDCQCRDRNAYYPTSRLPEMTPGTEKDLLETWQKRFRDRPMSVPNTFKDLAALGERDDATHLATIHADGNKIGELRKEVHNQQNKGYGTGFDLPAQISGATWQALVEGLDDVTDDAAEFLPAIPHLVGGDDVLITLPAHRAWAFCRVFQAKFSEYLRTRITGARLSKITEPPTMSAAIVFHHYQSPLSQAADLAGRLLADAKDEHRGAAPALAWLDITHDGPQPIPGRPSLLLDDLAKVWDDLNILAKENASARVNLAALTRTGDTEQLLRHAERLGLDDVVRRFTGQPLDLGAALGMVRWWRTA